MKTTIRLLTTLALALAVFGQHTTASAGGGTNNGHFKDLGADAYFQGTDPSRCIVTEVLLFASQHYFQSPPGPGISEPFVSLDIFQIDVCTGTQLFQASGGTTTSIDLQVDKKMDWVTLSAVVPVFEGVSQTFMDMHVELAWTAVGPRTHQNHHEHFKSPGCHMMFRSNGVFRSAEASGSISNGITNYAPETALVADIFSTKSGNVFVGCQ
jgi:hypothetical protein